jgi:hypothetical protein
MNLYAPDSSYKDGERCDGSKNERVDLEMKIMKYRAMARQVTDEKATRRLTELIAELEQKKREIDE